MLLSYESRTVIDRKLFYNIYIYIEEPYTCQQPHYN
jgi:hypothetical protein